MLDARGFVIAAVGISGPGAGFRKAVLPGWGAEMIDTAARISDAIGGGGSAPALGRVRLRASEHCSPA